MINENETTPAESPAPLSGDEPAATATSDDETATTGSGEPLLPEARYEDLPANLQASTRAMGWTSLMPVQARSMPYLLQGRDAMVQARTGSGKTGAFVLPILTLIDPKLNECQGLILVPTRELCLQVSREATALAEGTGVRVVAVYGGVGYGAQRDALNEGAHIVVGTPGRLLDLLLNNAFKLRDLDFIIFDEADRMMSMGFYPDMVALQRFLPVEKCAFMFSATFPEIVMRLARQFMDQPEFLSLSQGSVHIAGMEHIWYEVPAMDKDRCLVRVIELENPASAMVFCNTKDKVNYVCTVLQRFGYDADQLTADLAQNAREKVLERVRQGDLRFLIATDVAARGIDIPGLSHVFLYDFPDDPESYIHRAGRTARAGAGGTAISLVALTETGDLNRAEKRFNINMIQKPVPTDEDVSAVVAERTTVLMEAKMRDRDRLQIERMQRFVPLVKSLIESDEEVQLLAMLLDDYYQDALHGIFKVPEVHERVQRAPGRKTSDRGGPGGPPRARERSSDRPRDEKRGGAHSAEGERKRSRRGGRR
ncbi:ATP-dependent helicase [candidate division BRC1 bacterium HGW-BRC1-1]|jgi:ATP-dependent RNA helicase DeaD|nr:MAG: ATP-dependent helicase [candidate division BRC1 bacterium HGW-BRC1-1]